MDVPLCVIVNLFHSELLPQQCQKVGVPLVADLAGQQHHSRVRAQMPQSRQEGHEGVLQVNDVCAQHYVKPCRWVTFEGLAPAQFRHQGGSPGVSWDVGLYISREKVQGWLSVGDRHPGPCKRRQ